MRFGQLGAPLLTPVFRLTLKGRPPWNVAMPESCQPPTMCDRTPSLTIGLPGPNGSSATQLKTNRCRTSKPDGPCPASRFVTVCGRRVAPPPLAAELP